MNKEKNVITLSDLPLIAFLCIKKIPLISFYKDQNSGRIIFTFPDTKEVARLKMDFINDSPIPARSFYYLLKDIRRKIHECMKNGGG